MDIDTDEEIREPPRKRRRLNDFGRNNERQSRNTNNRGDSGSRHWLLTLNNWTATETTRLLEYVQARKAKYVVQEETGSSGTPHLQGAFSFRQVTKKSALKNVLPRAHWEEAKNVYAIRNYCSKIETRSGKIYSEGLGLDYVTADDVIRDKGPYPWQKKVLDMTKDRCDRHIIWVFEPKGATGKTALARHLCLNNKKAIYVSGGHKDVCFGVKKSTELVIWDVPRSVKDYLSYNAIESIKNGIFYKSKYESEMVIMPKHPVVLCFANSEPDYGQLSEDRWKVYRIKNGDLQPHSYCV